MKKTVLVDLDGVLADYSQGFKGIEGIGLPIHGAVEFVKSLSIFAKAVLLRGLIRLHYATSPADN